MKQVPKFSTILYKAILKAYWTEVWSRRRVRLTVCWTLHRWILWEITQHTVIVYV